MKKYIISILSVSAFVLALVSVNAYAGCPYADAAKADKSAKVEGGDCGGCPHAKAESDKSASGCPCMGEDGKCNCAGDCKCKGEDGKCNCAGDCKCKGEEGCKCEKGAEAAR